MHVCIYRLSRNEQVERDSCAKRTFHLFRHSSRNPCLSRFPLGDSDCMILAFLNKRTVHPPPVRYEQRPPGRPVLVGGGRELGAVRRNFTAGHWCFRSLSSHHTCLTHQRAPRAPFAATLSLPLQTPRPMKRPGAQPNFAGVQEQTTVCCMMP
jgi:hypothetical protein